MQVGRDVYRGLREVGDVAKKEIRPGLREIRSPCGNAEIRECKHAVVTEIACVFGLLKAVNADSGFQGVTASDPTEIVEDRVIPVELMIRPIPDQIRAA